jgi:LPXTG-site transpeptidase (sortase) family protein
MVFTIRVSNIGNAAATNVSVTDQFPTYLTVTNQSTTQGTATLNSNTRTVTVSVGTINAGGSVTITITTRVNTSATTTLTLSNTATAQYTTSSGTDPPGSISFQVIGTSTLPGTGWGPPAPAPIQTEQPRPVSLLSLLFLVLGLAAFGAAFLLKGLRRERALLVGIGVWMLVLGAVFSPAVRGWLRPTSAIPVPATAVAEAQVSPVPTDEALTITWATPEVIETLPNYPIPIPEITPTPGEDPPDSSAIQRILIPALGLDTVVKYVPYDGYTWMIAGLRQEVAWMGETSWPGLGGNTALAGHITLRDGGNGPFRYLEELVAGDEVTLFTEQNIYKYRVRERQIVAETDTSVVKPGDNKELTLITCTGWDADSRFYLERLVVSADLVDVEPIRIETRGLFFPQNQSH